MPEGCHQCLEPRAVRGVGEVLGQTGAEAAPGTEPAVRCDFQSTHSVGSLRKTIGFAGGWGGWDSTLPS